jgi:hypothetical protein
MYQDDAFGQAGLAGVKRALDKRKMELAAEGTFERNTVAVKGALLAVRRAKPDAVIMIAPYPSFRRTLPRFVHESTAIIYRLRKRGARQSSSVGIHPQLRMPCVSRSTSSSPACAPPDGLNRARSQPRSRTFCCCADPPEATVSHLATMRLKVGLGAVL